jgi:hypothetical protein
MWKIFLKITKVFFGISLFFILLLTIAILWPVPELPVPVKHERILIKSINVIDVKSGKINYKQNILVENNKITAIIPVLDTDLKVDLLIDGTDKFAIPGLWDMHTHSNQLSEWLHHPLYIANGVTGVRDMSGQLNKKDSYWAGTKERLQWNKGLDNFTKVTPRYVLQSSYQIDGAASVPDNFPAYFKLEKTEDVDALLNFYQKDKTDFIKVYSQILPNSYRKLALEAPKYGIHLAGHKPVFVSLKEAILLGQKSFEHGRIFMYEAFPKADSLRIAKDWKRFFVQSRKSMIQDFDSEIALDLMKLMQKNNTYWVPTLQTLKFEAFAHKESFLNNENLKYISTARKKLWWGFDIKGNKKRNLSEANKGVSTEFYEAAKKQIQMANEIGVPIMAGTDVTDSYTFAGFSMHDELKELTESGLTNLEALQSATIIPAKFANLDENFGTIESGKNADLIILEKNPLENITHSSSISGVLINGIYYNIAEIEALKSFTASVASSFHMNVKIIYGFLKSPLIRVQFAD